jgi:signal transduction histidine kinase/CheY-like chemotaxis protein/sensor domain CHASE-containing protein
MNLKNSSTLYRYWLIYGVALFSSFLGLAVVVGWHAEKPALIQVFPNFVPMQYNTALGFIFGGLSLLATLLRRQILSLIFGSCVLVLGALTLWQYITQTNLGIDEVFMEHYILTKSYHPGRMAPNTSLCFTLFGIAQLLSTGWRGKPAVVLTIITILSTILTALGAIALVGYSVGVETAYGWGHLTRMAVHTSVGMMTLGIGIFLNNSLYQSTSVNKAHQWGAPLLIGMVVLVVVLWQSLVNESAGHIRIQVDTAAKGIQKEIVDSWNSQFSALLRMSSRWEQQGGTPEEQWEHDAQAYVDDLSGFKTVARVNSASKIDWTASSSKDAEPNQIALGSSIHFRSAMTNAKKYRIPAVSPIFFDKEGMANFIVSIPLYVNNQFDGAIIGTYLLSDFIKSSTEKRIKAGYAIQIDINGTTAYDSSDVFSDETAHQVSLLKQNGWSSHKVINLGQQAWTLTVTPTPELMRSWNSSLPLWVLLVGLGVTGTLTALFYLVQLTRTQAKALSAEVKERKFFENDLKLTRDRLSLAASTAALGIWEWDMKTNELAWDDRMFEIYGALHKKSLGNPLYEFWRSRVHPEDLHLAESTLLDAVKKGAAWHHEFRIRLEDDSIRYIRANAACEVEHGQVVRMIGGNLDFTQQKELIFELEATKVSAEKANQAKSQFLANMSHEIRTPMNGVIGVTELLNRTSLSEQQKSYLNMVRSSANALLDILNDILDLSKIEAGKLELEATPFDVHEIVGDATKCFSGTATSKGLDLGLYIHPEVPHWLIGDPVRLKQIIFNLLGNAIKFTESGSVTVELNWETSHNSILSVTVSDTGIGIPKSKQESIFSPFTQADETTTRHFGGTGLGLTIVTQLIDLMQGELSIESEEQKGSIFSVKLPLQIHHEENPKYSPNTILQLQTLNIAVIERRKKHRRWLVDALTSWDCQVMLYTTVEELAENIDASNEHIDVLIIENHWVGMDCIELEETIKRLEPLVDLIIIIGYSSVAQSDLTAQTDSIHVRQLASPVKHSEIYDCLTDFVAPNNQTQCLTSSERKSTSPGKILVVEDNPINQLLIDELLSDEGHQVTIAEHGQEALEILNNETFDLIFMDIQMPTMDGYEATRAIRAMDSSKVSSTPIIALTANAFKEDRSRCLDAGMNDFLTKPLEPIALFDCLQRWSK